jgi:hypothetical protein
LNLLLALRLNATELLHQRRYLIVLFQLGLIVALYQPDEAFSIHRPVMKPQSNSFGGVKPDE